jgi:hypothetical protein
MGDKMLLSAGCAATALLRAVLRNQPRSAESAKYVASPRNQKHTKPRSKKAGFCSSQATSAGRSRDDTHASTADAGRSFQPVGQRPRTRSPTRPRACSHTGRRWQAGLVLIPNPGRFEPYPLSGSFLGCELPIKTGVPLHAAPRPSHLMPCPRLLP